MMRQNWNWLLQPFYLDADGRYGQRLSHGSREPVAPGAACDDDRWRFDDTASRLLGRRLLSHAAYTLEGSFRTKVVFKLTPAFTGRPSARVQGMTARSICVEDAPAFYLKRRTQ